MRWCSAYVTTPGLALDVGRAVEVRRRRGEAVRPGVVGEGPAHRVRRREHEAPARPQHPGRLRAHRAAVGDERHDAVGREHAVDAGVAERQRQAVALEQGERVRMPSRRRPVPASIRRAVRSIPIDRSLATTRTSWCRASQREHWAAPAPISSTVIPSRTSSRSSSASVQPSGPQTKALSPRKAPCSA